MAAVSYLLLLSLSLVHHLVRCVPQGRELHLQPSSLTIADTRDQSLSNPSHSLPNFSNLLRQIWRAQQPQLLLVEAAILLRM